ncbi:MAG: S1 RNA-binding domain-containing protein [Myxococcota bacterium]|jgi:small subunit ribosomal protein S1|nr:S1 RNA-binding domain-containing protein [Myxococcota bacterium]
MSEHNENSNSTEEVGEGLKMRKKQDGGATQPPAEQAPAEPAVAAAPKQESAPAPAKAAKEEKAFDPSTLSRRVVDPREGDASAKRNQVAPEPVRTFNDSVTTDDFAALFEEAGASASPSSRYFEVGERVEAVVTHIDSSSVYVDLGGRNEARAPRAHYIDEEGNLEINVGETHEFFVLGFKGGIQLGKHLDAGQQGVGALEDAQASGVPMLGRVTSKNKGGFVVDISGIETFCPVSQIDLYNAEDLDVYVGQTFNFKVMEVRDGGRSIVVSRAALLREEADRQRGETMAKLAPGEILSGVVRSISDFGAFVDLGGVDGLVHISELSWGNVDKPADVVSEGQTVEVKVLDIEQRDGKRPRISLSMKQAQEDPWGTINEKFHVGMTTRGSIVRTAPFGAFVEIAPGIDGLVHVSEMSWDHVRQPSDVVDVGQVVDVQILDIDLVRQRISLSMKAAEGDPWSDIDEKYPIGSEVTGHVEKIEDFGVFVSLEGGITALLPRSEMDLGRGETPHSKSRIGHDVTARVLSIEKGRRRMALSLRSGEEIEESADTREPRGNNRGGGGGKSSDRAPRDSGPRSYSDSSSGGFGGTFGDLFKKKK